MQDVLKGPAFWLQDMEMRQKRAEIQGFAAPETMLPIDRHALNRLRWMPEIESRLRRGIRVITLNGFLLPSFLLKDGIVHQHKGFAGSLRNIFRFRQVLYEHEPTQTGYIARHDKTLFFPALLAFCLLLIKFVFQGARLRASYQAELPHMTSEAFWRHLYNDEIAPKTQPADTGARLPA